MPSMRTLLGKMRGRLGMYTGATSITKLAAFLRGYELALFEHGEQDHLLHNFRDWIQQRFGTTTVSWEGLILRESVNEEDAVNRFYDLLDEFLKEDRAEAPMSPAAPLENQTFGDHPVSGTV